MTYPPCAIGSSDSSSPCFSFVSNPANAPISRPPSSISALERGSALSAAKISFCNWLHPGRDASSLIAHLIVGSLSGISTPMASTPAADLKTP